MKRNKILKTKIVIISLIALFLLITITNFAIQNISLNKTDKEKERLLRIDEKSTKYEKAPEISNPSSFINTEKISITELSGKKAILVNFCTYSSINCQRWNRYLNAWYEVYKEQGLEIIGIQSPEFEFEKSIENVKRATESMQIKYPVVIDNNLSTLRAYDNIYSPRIFLIDIDGFVVYTAVGETEYKETEEKIKEMLEERKRVLNLRLSINKDLTIPSDLIPIDLTQIKSQKAYFGANKNTISNGKINTFGLQNLSIPDDLVNNKLYLGGIWNFTKEYAQSISPNSKFFYTFTAREAYILASSKEQNNIRIKLDGKFISNTIIQGEALYNLISEREYNTHVIEIVAEKPGLKIYTLSFG